MKRSDPPFTMRTLPYGPEPSQAGDLYRPFGPCPPVVVLLHGGFWRYPYGREQMVGLAEALAAQGYAVWNLGYRRVGEPGGGWPGTLRDAAAGVDHLAALAASGEGLDLSRVAAVGHSAGGQLALWLAAERRRADGPVPPRVRLRGAAGLAAVTDLAALAARPESREPVAAFLGGAPEAMPERCAAASPRALLPLGAPQLIVHGTRDEALPLEFSRNYAEAARTAGDPVDWVAWPGAGHMDHLEPRGPGWAALLGWLDRFRTAPEEGER